MKDFERTRDAEAVILALADPSYRSCFRIPGQDAICQTWAITISRQIRIWTINDNWPTFGRPTIIGVGSKFSNEMERIVSHDAFSWLGFLGLCRFQCHLVDAALEAFCHVNALNGLVSQTISMPKANQLIRPRKTRANTGHAVLQCTSKPPKMRSCNGPTDQPTDRRTEGRKDPLIEMLCGA